MFSSEFLMLAGAHLLALASPGPDFLLLTRSVLRHGRRSGMGVAAGIALGNGAHIVMAVAGFSLLQQAPVLLLWMKWLASAWLAWMGWMFIRASRSPLPAPPDCVAFRQHGWRAGCGAGVLSALLNPKNGLFYFGLFTLMVGAQTPTAHKLWYGLWMFGVVWLWDAALVWAVGRPAVGARLGRVVPWMECCAGVLLLGVAVALALSRW